MRFPFSLLFKTSGFLVDSFSQVNLKTIELWIMTGYVKVWPVLIRLFM